MRSRTLWGFVVGAALCAFLTGTVSVLADERPADASKANVDRAGPAERVPSGNLVVLDDPNLPIADNQGVPPTDRIKLSPLPAGTTFIRHVVGKDAGDGTTALAESVIYSNTNGLFSAQVLPGFLVSDDISTTATDDCPLSRFTFQVTGRGEPSLPEAPYGVSWALYGNCPLSWSSADRPLLQIAGTNGSLNFADGAPREITFFPPVSVPLPTTFWLGLTFTGDNAGMILGAPALEGYSGDVFDFPGFACNANMGGFPTSPHASFNIEVFGDNCTSNHTVYKAQRASGTPFKGGRNRTFVDDLNLLNDDCELVGYEVAVKEPAKYYFELRYSCGGGAIPGTQADCIIGASSAGRPRICRFKLAYICDDASPLALVGKDCLQDIDCRDDEHPNGVCIDPIPLPRSPWLAARITNDNGGVIVAGRQADIGFTQDLIFRDLGDGSCEFVTVGTGVHGSLHASITCDGEAARGACCDMFVSGCVGGPDEGNACMDNSDCADPGVCESLCREIPEANCPFPPPQADLRPQWIEGAACDPNPFVEGTCGQAACCYKDVSEDEFCTNLTKNECDAIPPLDNKRQWQRGRFCSLDNQSCPLNACLARQLPCTEPREDCPASGLVGCQDPDCCTTVCTFENQFFCCDVCWDNECAELAQILCGLPPTNDVCAGEREGDGAQLVTIPSVFTTLHDDATVSDTDPHFCCHDGLPFVCMTDGGEMSVSCETDADCQSGDTCQERPPIGLATVWYKFEAPEPVEGEDSTSVHLDTCLTSGPDSDSLLQVFSVNDPTTDETACDTLTLIGCSDDVLGCHDSGRNGELCLQNLVPGDMYYVMVAAKTQEAENVSYKLAINSPCIDADALLNDYCQGALPVDDGTNEFDMTGATLHCPADFCAPDMDKDLWYEYTATCTGIATIDTCSPASPVPPDTNLMVYEGCDSCPMPGDEPLACDRDSIDCEPASKVVFTSRIGECYKVRVGNQEGSNPIGTVDIACEALCGVGTVTFVSPLSGTTDARRPHAPDSAVPPMGIDTIVATAPAGALSPEICWRLCETADVGGEANYITGVTEGPEGTYTISLARPITPDAHTLIEYLGNSPTSKGRFYSHPGNTNDDFAVFADDVQLLVDALHGFGFPAWGDYSKDIDHSGMFTALDVLDAVDILNGGDEYNPPRNGTSKPGSTGCPVD